MECNAFVVKNHGINFWPLRSILETMLFFQKQIIIKIFIFLFGPILSNIFGKPNQWDKWKLSPGVDLYKEKETHLQKYIKSVIYVTKQPEENTKLTYHQTIKNLGPKGTNGS